MKRNNIEISLQYASGNSSKIDRKEAYIARMRSGKLTREKWVRNYVEEGRLVKDIDGRIFRIESVVPTTTVPVQLTTLVEV
jgi:hypothetical protein